MKLRSGKIIDTNIETDIDNNEIKSSIRLIIKEHYKKYKSQNRYNLRNIKISKLIVYSNESINNENVKIA